MSTPSMNPVGAASACAFCDAGLGANRLLDLQPAGETLAFDPAQELLWAVCPKCRSWNLSPLEPAERRQAIAVLEREFGSAATRGGAGGRSELGMAWVGDRGTILRVGRAGWREFAAWRFGDVLRRRRRDWHAHLGLSAVLMGVLLTNTFDRLLVGWAGWVVLAAGMLAVFQAAHRRRLYRGLDATGQPVTIRMKHASSAQVAGRGDDWALLVDSDQGPTMLTGRNAARALARILAGRNFDGASRADVDEVVTLVERAGGSHALFENWFPAALAGERAEVPDLPRMHRLALELAAHEEDERRALAAELAAAAASHREASERVATMNLL